MRHIGTRLALTCSLVLLSACSERVSFLAPKFQMGSNNAQALVVTPDGEVHESGKLTVSIRGFLDTLTKKRRLLATLADVEKVVVEVSASGLSFSQTLDKTAIASGTTSATFTGIPEGAATVTMKAYNLTNQLIGQASKATSVTAGATTTVEIQLQLDPTYTQPSSGGSTSTGSITTNGTIIDGPTVDTFQLAYRPWDVAIAPNGDAWVTNFEASEHVSRLGADGSSLTHFQETGLSFDWGLYLEFAPTGDLWIGNSSAVRKYSNSWQLLEEIPLSSQLLGLNVTSAGDVWLLHSFGSDALPEKYSSDGTHLLAAVADPAMPEHGLWRTGFTTDSEGNLWQTGGLDASDGLSPYDLDTVTKFSPSGQQLAVYSLPAGSGADRIVADQTDHLWIPLIKANAIAKVAPDGTLVGTFPLPESPGDIAIDPSGNVWLTYYDSDNITQLSQQGEIVGTYAMPHTVTGIAAGSSGVWVISSDKKISRLTSGG